jgi:hypothetical protein
MGLRVSSLIKCTGPIGLDPLRAAKGYKDKSQETIRSLTA